MNNMKANRTKSFWRQKEKHKHLTKSNIVIGLSNLVKTYKCTSSYAQQKFTIAIVCLFRGCLPSCQNLVSFSAKI